MRRLNFLIAYAGRASTSITEGVAGSTDARGLCIAAAAHSTSTSGSLAAGAGASASASCGHPHQRQLRGFAAAAGSGSRRGAGGAAESAVVDAAEAARRVMSDPMSRLMASQGMPVGLSLGAAGDKGAAASGKSGRAAGGGGADAHDDDGGEDVTRPPPAAPGYDMEALSDMLRATAASARQQQQPAAASGSSSGNSSSSSDGDGGFMAGVQQLGRSPLDDAWGTTRESPADIARRIVESNTAAGQVPDLDALARAADADLAAAGAAPAADDDDEDEDSPMRLSPSEEKYKSLEAMSADIKKLDEVFEVLASVPWLSEDVLAEKELRGVAQVGLLGTLEEVGFNIRHQLERIWAGERGADLAAGPGLQFRDQAALMAILYHTQQIEDAHGPPEAGYLPPPPPLPEGAAQEGAAVGGGGGSGARSAAGLPDAGEVLEMLARKEKP